ncbi:hypothetical protein L1987_31314 [Smallanthus sonchifolius]|uniref:Uncharacterized protein n=1 Tax=Smallanthus sonchifolius TaxID=185202 RepID=A0ACB9I711_9ASTR|nr:hypothetical protein L1987_31314 [Smallanthus sonchifolius]
MESHINQQAPKLEDFLSSDTTTTVATAATTQSMNTFLYTDVSQTETQDSSSLTHIFIFIKHPKMVHLNISVFKC